MMLIPPTQKVNLTLFRNISFNTIIHRLKIYIHNENLACDKNVKKIVLANLNMTKFFYENK